MEYVHRTGRVVKEVAKVPAVVVVHAVVAAAYVAGALGSTLVVLPATYIQTGTTKQYETVMNRMEMTMCKTYRTMFDVFYGDKG
jgi:hypothetical protein